MSIGNTTCFRWTSLGITFHANLKYNYGNRHFWFRGYLVDTEGGNEKAIQEYVRNQLHEDIASDQMCMREFKDPFTGEPVVRGK